MMANLRPVTLRCYCGRYLSDCEYHFYIDKCSDCIQRELQEKSDAQNMTTP